LDEVTKNVAKTIKKSLKVKNNLTIFMSYVQCTSKLAITREKDLMDFEMGYLKKKKK